MAEAVANPAPAPAAEPTAPAGAPAAPDQHAMDVALVKGIAWTTAAKWSVQAVTWATTFVVARLLMPRDYGLFQMALVYLGLATLLSEMGVGLAVVTLRNMTDEQLAQLNGLAVALGTAAMLLSWSLSEPVGAFFSEPKLPPVIIVMSLSFTLLAFRVVPYSLLQRDLNFKLLAMIDAAQAIGNALMTLLMAALGFGYWSLVLGSLFSSGLATALTVWRRPYAFRVPRPRQIPEAMEFCRQMVIANVAWYAYSRADSLVAGKVLGASQLGFYAFALTLGSMAVDRVTALVSRVTPAFFAAAQDDPAAVRRYLLKITEGLAVLTFPVTIGMALVADVFVLTVLGEKWAGAIVPLRILSLYAAFRSLSPLPTQVLRAVGEAGYVMRVSVMMAVVMPIGFFVGAQWGIGGVAAAWAVVHPMLILLLVRRTCRAIQLSPLDYAKSIWPALSGAVPMALAVLATRTVVGGTPLAAQLAIEAVVGAATYLGIMLVMHRERMSAFVRLIKLARRGRPPAVAAAALE